MLVRVFVGERWEGAAHEGDWRFDALPAVGDKLALAFADGWGVGEVRDRAHRLTDPNEAADVALLVSPLAGGGSIEAAPGLPFAALDRLGGAGPGAASPWGR